MESAESRGNDREGPPVPPRRQVARPIDHSAAHVVMGMEGPMVGGPWSFVTDLPNPHRELIGPPPGYLALAGWVT